jgi:hypothetical protein
MESLSKGSGLADELIELADGERPASPEHWPDDGSMTK